MDVNAGEVAPVVRSNLWLLLNITAAGIAVGERPSPITAITDLSVES